MLKLNEVLIKLSGKRIVQDFNLELEKGECVAISGVSGCGKTTLLRAIAGLIPVQFGDVLTVSKRIAYLFQEPRLLPWLTVCENLKLIVPNISKKELLTQLQQLHLNEFDANKYPSELSGGMKQRVALARALITKPDLLLMDEPFSALDQTLRQELQNMIMSQIEKGLAVVLVTHDMQEAVKMAHRIYCMQGNPALCSQCITLDTVYAERDEYWIQQHARRPELQGIANENARL